MTKTKLSKKEVALSVLTLLVCYIALVLVMFLMLVINNGFNIAQFLKDNASNVVTVVVSSALLSMIIYVYFFIEDKRVLAKVSKIVEIYLLLCLAMLICNVISKFVNPTARPLLFFSLIIAMFFKRREAIFLNSVYALLLFIFNRFLNSDLVDTGTIQMVESFSSLLTIFCAGILGIFLLKNVKTRLGSIMVAIVLFVPAIIINVVMKLPISASAETLGYTVLYSVLDCVFSALLFLCILPIMEGMFSELTPFRLRELTSDSSKLIKKLKTQALGTYNHSVVVAQLAEACANAIGEDSELARAAAYYHDVGKLKSPEMFTENQSEYDMHKELTPELSVDIIRSHTKEGAKLIKKNRLPDFFADVAVEHHGTLPIKYFYAKALKLSDGELNIGNYSYPGPTPSTKISAIIMIADASEAAARSLSDRSPEKVAALVSSLVEERMNLDQFVDCDITMRELTIVTQTVINQLAGVYHSRVKYPKLVITKK